jgi:outer membrane protein OmpA-like peptidoglycan-associated protein
MYLGSHIGNWQFEVGDEFRSIEANLSGRGAYTSYTTSKFKAELIGTKNLRTFNYNIGTTQRYKFSRDFAVNSGFVYNQNDIQNFSSYLALLGTNFSIGKSHQLYVMGAYNQLKQSIDGKSQHNEFGGELKYNSVIGKLNTSINAKYGSDLYFGNYRGRLYVNYQSILPFSSVRRLQINGFENWNEVPRVIDGVSDYTRSNKTRDVAAQYFEFISPEVMLNAGIGYEEFDWRGISPLVERSFIHTQGLRAIVGARFKIDETNTFLSPQVVITKGNVMDYPSEINALVQGIENRKSYSYQYFSLNLRSQSWGFMTTYTSGPKSIFDQYTYFFNARANRRLRVMPYIDKYIYKDQLQLMANISYSNDLVSRSTYTNITTQLYWHLPHNWRVNLLSAYSLQRRVDGREASQTYQTIYIEAGIKKEFNWSHPRISYNDVTLIFFKDFNGNGVQDPNEPGIKNVLINLQRHLTPEIGSIPGDITSIDLLSDDLGRVYLNKIPGGLYALQYNPVGGETGTFSKALGDLDVKIDENTTLYFPFVEKNKVFGKIILNRSRLSGLGKLDVSNVRVTATDSQGRSYSTLTDRNGEFVLFAPITDEYIVTINNIYYENFDLRQNSFLVQFNGYKQFEVNFVFDEKVRRINFAANDENMQQGVQQVRRTTISGSIKDANTQQPVRAKVNLINTRTNAIVNSVNSSATSGDYTLNFMASDDYLLEVLADDYWYFSENLILQQVTTFMNINRNIQLKPISVGSSIELNIRFDANSDYLAPESVAELNRLLRQVKNNPTVRLEIQGHCDDLEAIQKPDIGRDRAGAVAKYLIENGFSNVEVKDMKNEVPITTNDTEEGRARNRRIDVVVLRR